MATTTRKSRRRSFGAVRRLASGRYQARYRGPDGLERPAPRTFATKTEADQWLAGMQADITRDVWRAPERGADTLADYFTAWLDARAVRRDLAPRTLEHYQHLAERWLLPRFSARVELGTVPINRITPALVREWHTEVSRRALANATPKPPKAPTRNQSIRTWAAGAGHRLAPAARIPGAIVDAWRAAGAPMLPTPPARPAPEGAGRTRAAQAYTLLHTVLGTALHDELIAANPCRIRGARKVTHTERVPATPAQVDQIAAAIPPRYAAAVRVAAWSGLRGGELFALRRADVDLDAGTLRVSRALVELTGQPLTYGPPKSEAGRRTVHLPRTIVDVLAQHLETFTETVPEALVFTTEAGGPVSRRVRGQHFAKARAAAGRPDLRWHDLRHTGAVLAASTGASIAELQHRLGHSTYAAAMNYQHASASRDAELADRLDLLLGGTGPHPSDPPSPPSPAPSPPGASTTGVARDTDATSDTDEKHTAATILPFAKRPTRSRRLG